MVAVTQCWTVRDLCRFFFPKHILLLFKIPEWVWVHPSGKKSNIEWGLLWNLLACASLAGPKRLIDEKTAGDLMPLLVLPDTKTTPRVSIQQNMTTNWNHGGNKIYMLPLNFPQIHFQGGGNTICRMLALQKEIGVGRGWQMKMNGTVWSLGVCVWNWFGSFWSHRHAVMWLTPLQTSLFSPAVWIKTQLGPSMLFTYSEETAIFTVCNAVCRWRRQRLFFFFFLMRCIPPLMTQGADR